MERGTSFIAFACFVGLITVGPELIAQRLHPSKIGPTTVPLPPDHVERVQRRLSVPSAALTTSDAIHHALKRARARSLSKYELSALAQARKSFDRAEYAQTTDILRALEQEVQQRLKNVNDPQLVAALQKSRLFLANTYVQQKEWRRASETLSKISASPVQDYVDFLRAESLIELGKFEQAAELFDRVREDSTSPLVHRATIARSHALFAAKKYEEAAAEFEVVIGEFPQYPRRFAAMYEYAVTLEQLGRATDAADAYQEVWFEFPYKEEGKKARKQLERLESDAVVPSRLLSARQLFARYRRLRVNKHWDLTTELLTELREDYASEDGHSAFEHQIDFQLALNDYHSRNFDRCIQRIRALLGAWESGHRKGIDKRQLHRYLSSIYGRRGDHSAGLAHLRKMTESLPARGRALARAEYLEKHGKYSEAYTIYSTLMTTPEKRGWHFNWLRYRTGRLEDAYVGFRALAENSGGRRRAKYLYWAGRTLERGGLDSEAASVFLSVRNAYGSTYYGIQAANRLVDLEQRTSVHGSVGMNTESLSQVAAEALDALDDAQQNWAPEPRVDKRGSPKRVSSVVPDIGPQTGKVCEPAANDRQWCEVDESRPLFTAYTPVERLSDPEPLEPDDVDMMSTGDAVLPPKRLKFPKNPKRLRFATQARIYWGGRLESDAEFDKMQRNDAPGILPSTMLAYDNPDYIGGLERAVKAVGDLFPELERTEHLFAARMLKAARQSMRYTALEYRELRSRARPRNHPIAIDRRRWNYQIDNRRTGQAGFWGVRSEELMFPISKERETRQQQLLRQQQIYDRRESVETALVDAMKEVGDYFLVRKHAQSVGGWFRENPAGPKRDLWMKAYPRAFPELVIPHAKKVGVNPYLLWALMCVESSFNPDSISYADALGLLQVIPRTGLKTAILFDEPQFGPLDLLESDVAIEHGAFYFDKLVEKFRGQETLAIPGYNGGPHRVGDWLEMRGEGATIDEFIEEIPFDQARGYVKKVIRFLALYLRIYEGEDGVYVGQNIRQKYLPHPKF